MDEVICQKHGIGQDALENWIKRYEKEPEIKAKDDLFQNALKSVLEGEVPHLQFNIPANLTKDIYFKCYKKILGMNLHIYYKAIQKKIKQNEQVSLELVQTVKMEEETGRAAKRDLICASFDIEKPEGGDYSKIMLKAYYSFKREEQFFKNAESINKEYKLLLQEVFNGEDIPILENDPLPLNEEEFDVRKLKILRIGILENPPGEQATDQRKQ